MVAYMVNNNKETVRRILHDDWNIIEMCAKLISERKKISVKALDDLPTSSITKQARMSKSELNATLMVFFNYKGVFLIKSVPGGRTFIYQNTIDNQAKSTGKKKQDLLEKDTWMHEEHASLHKEPYKKQLLSNQTHFYVRAPSSLAKLRSVRLLFLYCIEKEPILIPQ